MYAINVPVFINTFLLVRQTFGVNKIVVFSICWYAAKKCTARHNEN